MFALYAPHRSAQAVRAEIGDCPTREIAGAANIHGGKPHTDSLALLSASASKKDGKLIVSLSNRQPDAAQEVTLTVRDGALHGGTLHTMAGAANAHNSADQPDAVGVTQVDIQAQGDTLTLTLPPCSVQTLTLNLA